HSFAPAARMRAATAVGVGHPRRRGARLLVPLLAEGLSALDAEIIYDPTRMKFRGVRRAGSAQQDLLATHESRPGVVALSVASAQPLPAGAVAELLFTGRRGDSSAP